MIKIVSLVCLLLVWQLSCQSVCDVSTQDYIFTGVITLGPPDAATPQNSYNVTLPSTFGVFAQVFAAFSIVGFQAPSAQSFYSLMVDTVQFTNQNTLMMLTMAYQYNNAATGFSFRTSWTKVRLSFVAVSTQFQATGAQGNFIWAGSTAVTPDSSSASGVRLLPSFFQQIASYAGNGICGYIANPPGFDLTCDAVGGVSSAHLVHYYVMGFQFDPNGTHTLASSVLYNTGTEKNELKVIYDTVVGSTGSPFYGPLMTINDYSSQLKFIKVGVVITTILDTTKATYPAAADSSAGFIYSGVYMGYTLYNVPKGISYQNPTGENNVYYDLLLNAKYQIYGFSRFEILSLPANQTIIDVSLTLPTVNQALLNTDNIDYLQNVFVAADLWNNVLECDTTETQMLNVASKVTTTVPAILAGQQNVFQIGQPLNFQYETFQSDASTSVTFTTTINFLEFKVGYSYGFEVVILNQASTGTIPDPVVMAYSISIDGNEFVTDSVSRTSAQMNVLNPANNIQIQIGYIPSTTTPTLTIVLVVPRPEGAGQHFTFQTQTIVNEYSKVYNPINDCCEDTCPANSGFNVNSNPPSCTICGDGNSLGLIYNSVSQQCICQVGHYQIDNVGSTFSCYPCYAQLCQNCTVDLVTQCLSCVTGASFNGTICECNTGFYQNGALCSVCPVKCLLCSVNTTCTACSDNVTRDTADNCNCRIGYFDSGSSVCTKCSDLCKTCTNSSSCATCFTENNRTLINGQCVCKTGFYNMLASNGSLVCGQCDATCQACSLLPNLCSDCDATANLILGYDQLGHQICVCRSGYNKDSNGNCIASNCGSDPYCSDCKTVLSSTVCIRCIASLNRMLKLPEQKCVCKQGFYELNGICTACSSGCAKCTNATTCTSCVISATPAANGVCNCRNGYHFISTPIRYCRQCPMNCTTCISAEVCTTCATNFTLANNICSCPTGKFIDPTTGLCLPCVSGCNNCENATFCNSCIIPQLLQGGACVRRCSPGYYQAGFVCAPCTAGCSFCQTAFICTICQNGRYAFNGQCYTNCPSGAVANTGNSTCSTCNTPCSTCTEHPSKCLSCKPNCGYLFNFECLKSCPVGTYQVNGTCLYCSYNCKTCLGSNITCTSCPEGKVLYDGHCHDRCPYVMIGGICTFNCAIGLYKTNLNQCLRCDSSCASCQIHPKNCTSCVKGFAYKGECVQNCPINFYNFKGLCVTCHESCYGCINNPQSCVACAPTYYKCGNLCKKTCPPGQFPQISSMTCFTCNGKCKTCSSRQFCTTCTNPQAVPVNGVCNECSYPCSTCTAPSSCTACVSGFSLVGNTCIASCPIGATSINGICQCQIGFISGTQCVTSCPNGFGPIGGQCRKCDGKCASCSVVSDKCTACERGFQLNLITSTCEVAPTCQFGQYFSSVNNACTRICPLGTYFFETVCLTACLSGYKDNGVGGCVQTNTQTGCSYPYFLSNGLCVSSCPAQSFANSNTRKCQECSSNCFSCLSNTFCFACNPGFDLVNGVCIASNVACPSGQFKYNSICYNTCPIGTCAKDGFCQRVCTAGSFSYNGGCYKNCPTKYNTDEACVEQCPAGTTLQGARCAASSNQCGSGQFFDSTSNSCKQCQYPCSECSLTGSFCTRCAPGLTLKENLCVVSNNNCGNGKYMDLAGVCRNCPDKCGNCVSSSSCSNCAYGYQFNGFDCVKSVSKLTSLKLQTETVFKRNNVVFATVCLSIIPNGLTSTQISKFFVVVPNRGDTINFVNQWISERDNKCVTSAITYSSLPVNSAVFLAVNAQQLASSYSSIGYSADASSFVSVSVNLNLPQAPNSMQIPPTATNVLNDEKTSLPVILAKSADELILG